MLLTSIPSSPPATLYTRSTQDGGRGVVTTPAVATVSHRLRSKSPAPSPILPRPCRPPSLPTRQSSNRQQPSCHRQGRGESAKDRAAPLSQYVTMGKRG